MISTRFLFACISATILLQLVAGYDPKLLGLTGTQKLPDNDTQTQEEMNIESQQHDKPLSVMQKRTVYQDLYELLNNKMADLLGRNNFTFDNTISNNDKQSNSSNLNSNDKINRSNASNTRQLMSELGKRTSSKNQHINQAFSENKKRVKRSKISQNIIQGEEADSCQWPWLVAVTVEDGRFACAASLINRYWLLSAAHCFFEVPDEEKLFAQLGAYNITAGDQQQTIPIIDIIIHYDYNPSTWGYNDIALLKLEHPIERTQCVRPAILAPPGSNPKADADCMIIGWGRTDTGSSLPMSDIVMQKSVVILSNQECQQCWDASVFSRPQIYPENICVDSVERDGYAACQGDSGSPLQCFDPVVGWVLEGVSAWGSSACKKYPSIYMREPVFYAWIMRNVLNL